MTGSGSQVKRLLLAFLLTSFLFSAAAEAGVENYTMHSGVSISSAVSIREASAIRFGNFAVTSAGDNGASIVLDINGNRTASQTGSTTITLLNGGYSDAGAQGAGIYYITGAGSGAALSVTFTDHDGTTGNPVTLTGPVGAGEFEVDNFTFNDEGGGIIHAGANGAATLRVGATLHTKSGVSTYLPGTYRGTFEILVSY